MKAALQWVIRRLGGYELYRVIGVQGGAAPSAASWSIRPIDAEARAQLAREAEAKPRELAVRDLPAGALMFALWNGAALLAVALYEPLAGLSPIWPHGPDDALALTDLWTIGRARGMGAATSLLRQSAASLDRPLIAWTWWTNRPATRAFASAGWRQVGWALRIARLPYFTWRADRRV